MSIIEVAVSITVMGMIGIVIGSSFSAIRASHEVSDDLVDARRLIAVQFSIFDQQFGPSRSFPGPNDPGNSDIFTWNRVMPTQVTMLGTAFPNVWARTPHSLQIRTLAPPNVPANPGAANQYYLATPPPAMDSIAAIPGVYELPNANAWHAWASLTQGERDRLTAKELVLRVFIAPLDIRDTQWTTGGAFNASPYRQQIVGGPQNGVTMWWAAQVEVTKGNHVVQSAIRIGP